MVDDVAAALLQVVAHGGVTPGPDAAGGSEGLLILPTRLETCFACTSRANAPSTTQSNGSLAMENRLTKPSALSALWRASKWLLAILLAGALTLGPASFLMHGMGPVDRHHLTGFQYWGQLLAVPAGAFGGFVFLACAFVPARKKRAGLLVMGLGLVFIGLGAYQHVTDDGFLKTQYMVRYTGFIVGLIGGFVLAHRAFKGTRWASYPLVLR